jgi:predicted MFS family arabinose efflux permease
VFVVIERRATDPVIRFGLFRRAPFSSGNAAILLSNFFMYATLLYTPIFLKSHGYPASETGILLFAFSFAMSLMSFFGSRMSRRFGSRRVVWMAFAIDGLAVLWYIGLTRLDTIAFVALGLIVAGVGSGIGTVSMQSTVLESVGVDLAGVSSGIYSTFRYLGSITASALVTLMVLHAGLHWILLAGVVGLGIATGFGFPTLTAEPAANARAAGS